ncbi:MAG: hypothetical protein U0517_01465 [Candidatus Andersenbacteria bacterium]
MILEKAPESYASDKNVDDHNWSPTLDYCLWMLDQILPMPRSTTVAGAARMGRWIGYVFARLESVGLITNKDSRDMARVDTQTNDV